MQRKRLWPLVGVLLFAGGMLYLLLSALTVQAVITSRVHTTVDDFTPGTFYHTGMTQQDDGEVALLRIGIAGEWISTNVEGLPPIWGHAMVEHGGYIYVLGGKLSSGLLTRTVYMSRINTTTYMLEPFTTTTLLPATAYPSGVYMHSAIVVSDHLYVIGGEDSSNIPTNTVMYATFNANGTLSAWQSAPSLPEIRSRVPAVASNGYIYVPGGKNDTGGGESAADSVFYATLDSTGVMIGWLTATANLPYKPSGHMVAAYGNRLYVMGGYDYSSYSVRPYVYFAAPATTTGDIETGGWVSTTVMPKSIIGGVAMAFNGEIFGLGGVENFPSGNPIGYARSALVDIESGHVITYAAGEAWYESPALSPDRVWHAAATSRDNRFIYVLGGSDGSAPLTIGILNRGSTTGQSGGHGYARSGWYIGPTIELGRDRKLLNFNWTADLPDTAVTMTMQYQTQDMAGNWSGWSPPIPAGGAMGIITTTVSFAGETRALRFQYRAMLTTTAPLSYTPYVQRVELVYDAPLPPQFEKRADPPSGQGVLSGQHITYTLAFTTNPNDVSPLRNVWITDTLPPYLAYMPGSITATAGIVSDTSYLPELRWNIASLPPGSKGQVGFVAVVSNAAPTGTWLDNLARFWSSDTDPTTSWTSHPVVELLSPVLTKTAAPATGTPVVVGQSLSYTLAYSNPNRTLPLDVTITDVLPLNTTWLPASWDPACTVIGGELRCKITVPPLSQGQVRFGVEVAQGTVSGTVIANTSYMVGCVTGAGVCTDNIASNSTSHRVANPLPPDLRKLATPPSGASVLRGAQINYTLVYTNDDTPLTLTDVTITDVLPSGVQLVSGSCAPACNMNEGMLTWSVGPLAPGQAGQVGFSVLVAQDVPSGTAIVNIGYTSGCAAAKCADVVASDSTTHTVTVAGGVGQISKSANPPGGLNTGQSSPTSPGALITYTLFYTNPNPSDPLTRVVINDPLPGNTILVSCTGGCFSNSTSISWTLASISPSVSGQAQFTVRVAPSAPDSAMIENQASLTSEQGQAYSNAVYHRVLLPYDLQLTKTNNVTATLPGETFTYTLVYTNSGPLRLSGVVITDYLGFTPPGEGSSPAMPYLTVVDTSPGWQPAQEDTLGSIYRYVVGTLEPNQTGALKMVVRLTDTMPYTVTVMNNRAVVADDGTHGYDIDLSNQSPSVNSPIQGPDLVILNPQVSPGPYPLGKKLLVTATVANQGLGGAFTWEHWLSPTNPVKNWFAVELYIRPLTFTHPGAPTGPLDHGGGYCTTETAICENSADQRYSSLYFVDLLNGLMPGDSVVVTWTTPLAAMGVYSVYIQVDTGFWWPPSDPPYGRVLEYDEGNNIVPVGKISTGIKVYLPIVMRVGTSMNRKIYLPIITRRKP